MKKTFTSILVFCTVLALSACDAATPDSTPSTSAPTSATEEAIVSTEAGATEANTTEEATTEEITTEEPTTEEPTTEEPTPALEEGQEWETVDSTHYMIIERHEDGSIRSEAVYFTDATPCSYKEYDANGNLTTDITYNLGGEPEYEYYYTFDENSNKIREERKLYFEDASENYSRVLDYNAAGRIIKDTTYNSEGVETKRSETDLDENNYFVGSREYVDGVLQQEHTVNNGSHEVRYYYPSGAIKWRNCWNDTTGFLETFDEAGNRLTYEEYDPNDAP